MKTKLKESQVKPETQLCYLPPSFIATGGEIDRLAVKAGYTSGLDWVNSGNQWTATLAEAREMLTDHAGEHTPTPWVTDGRMIIQEVEGRSFWPGQPYIADCLVSQCARPAGSTAANAQFIVRAVNSHTELLSPKTCQAGNGQSRQQTRPLPKHKANRPTKTLPSPAPSNPSGFFAPASTT